MSVTFKPNKNRSSESYQRIVRINYLTYSFGVGNMKVISITFSC